VQRTIERDLPEETTFLRRYDSFRQQVDGFIDMPESMTDLLFRFQYQNGGRLFQRARTKEFAAHRRTGKAHRGDLRRGLRQWMLLHCSLQCSDVFVSNDFPSLGGVSIPKPVMTVNVTQLLTLTNTKEDTLRSDQRRGQSVAAFGGDRPLTRARYLMIDGLAILVRDDFHRAGMKRMEAAWHVRAFWDQWGMAGARIEHREESVLFAAGELEDGTRWCANGRADQLPKFLKNYPSMRRLFVCNVEKLIGEMRARADEAGFDLTAGALFPEPDEQRFVKMLAVFRERRETSLQQSDALRRLSSRIFDVQGRRNIEAETCGISQL
jgi:hypothetical protein